MESKHVQLLQLSISEQKRYKNLRLILITVLAVTLLLFIYFFYQHQRDQRKISENQKQLINSSKTLVYRITSINETIRSSDTTSRLILYDILSNIPDYGDSSLKAEIDQTMMIVKNKGLNKELSPILSTIDTASAYVKETVKLLDKSDEDLIRLQSMVLSSNNSQPGRVQAETERINNNVKNILAGSQSPKLDSAIEINSTIGNNVKEVIPASPDAGNTTNANSSKNFGTAWFKEGYFLQYENLRILLLDLDKKKGIKVQICQAVGDEQCNNNNVIIDEKWLTYHERITLPKNNCIYVISLQNIDRAGNNPFKLAAYINVLKLGTDSFPFLLSNSRVKVYNTEAGAKKTEKVVELLAKNKVSVQNLGAPADYSIQDVKENQIVYYNASQLKNCEALQQLLQQNNVGYFQIRASSGFGYQSDHFKVYIVGQ